MGSFSYTCTISGLPIEAGDEVRILLLSESPYNEMVCTINDRWFPRGFPLKAKYNDYGSVEEVEEGPARDLWLDALKIDLRKRGWGDNSAHDVPTSKDMSFDDLLNAVQEGRVKVRDNVGDSTIEKRVERFYKDGVPKGVPTLKRIEKVIADASLSSFGGWGKEGYLVDVPQYGTVRIRWHGEGEKYGKDAEALALVQPLLDEYAAVIRAGHGSYAHDAEMLVFVKPGTKDYHGSSKEKKKSLLVQQAMIREDVWQALCAGSLDRSDFPPYKDGAPYTIKDYRVFARDFWDKAFKNVKAYKVHEEDLSKALSTDPSKKDLLQSLREVRCSLYFVSTDRDNPIGGWVGKDAIPFTVGVGTNFQLMLEKYLAGGVTEEQLNSWLDTVAEFVFVHIAIMPLRYWWRPSFSCGPQYGQWEQHEKAFTAFAGIAQKVVNEQEAQRKADDERYEAYEREEKAKKAAAKKAKKAKTTPPATP